MWLNGQASQDAAQRCQLIITVQGMHSYQPYKTDFSVQTTDYTLGKKGFLEPYKTKENI